MERQKRRISSNEWSGRAHIIAVVSGGSSQPGLTRCGLFVWLNTHSLGSMVRRREVKWFHPTDTTQPGHFEWLTLLIYCCERNEKQNSAQRANKTREWQRNGRHSTEFQLKKLKDSLFDSSITFVFSSEFQARAGCCECEETDSHPKIK